MYRRAGFVQQLVLACGRCSVDAAQNLEKK